MNDNWANKPRSRRETLQSFMGIGGMAAGAGLMASACAPAGPETKVNRVPIDFSDPKQSLRSFVKMTGDLDPTKETAGWFGGTIFGDTRRDRPLKPLVGVQGFGVLRCEPQADGSFRIFNRECAFYTDPKTGEFLDEWKNPYTKEICKVSPIHNLTVNAHLIVSEKFGTAIEMDFDGTLMEVPLPLGWDILDDTVMSTFEVHTAFPNELDPETWPRESAGKVLRIAEIFQRVVSLSELENDDLTSAHYAGTWTRVGPWLPWMRQGQADGQLIYRTFMAKNGTVDKLPEALVKHTREHLPDFFQAPAPDSWGGKNDSSFSVYAAENEPLPLLAD
ncbi:MAG: DUF1838 domain-containing protein [Gammaproteobacteria bacterium]|nr:DUF1838 domain-containing protein [Gammaproteobacteria bacterium]MCP4090761.1 DUF1838 domain-containing protein [Gammaproteobacteria bacterium]MCP4832810.1 DUF1838 domain-containing protein [Gammaproteobacteria bacterium]MCP4928002.1 DUF1838 domain-containing protein [Gammaproteobacteria bacterium]